MTLQQLKYVVTIARTGTIKEAANELYISQPSLTKSIKELEKEMGIKIFDRSNKGVTVSRDGEIFLGYARQVLEQAFLIEEKYKLGTAGKQEFCVSTQHYAFAVNAFVDLIKEYGSGQYDFSKRETQTYLLGTNPPESWKKAFPAEKKWPAECNEARKDCFDQEFQFLKEW